MNKKIKLIVFAIFSFIIFAITMFYGEKSAWIMIISLISFVTFMLSVHHIFLNVKTKSDSNT